MNDYKIEQLIQQLRIDYEVPDDQSMEDFGFWGIGLPANIGLDANDVIFHYNIYEIGPYVMGSQTVRFSREKMQKYFMFPL